jgi:hypothetical protein
MAQIRRDRGIGGSSLFPRRDFRPTGRHAHKSHESHRACRAVGLAEADPIRGPLSNADTPSPQRYWRAETLVRNAESIH